MIKRKYPGANQYRGISHIWDSDIMSTVAYRMECQHTEMADLTQIQERMKCGRCNRYRKVKAIESREWYFKCASCSYARYNGSSKRQAETLLAIHRIKTGHPDGSVWFRVVQQKKDAIRRLFGRKVRYVLTDDNKLYPDEFLPPAQSQRPIEDIDLKDKPPF